MKKKEKNLYEGMYIINAGLNEVARSALLEKITSGVTKRDGEVLKIHELGKKELAYEINGKKDGFYFLIYFSVGPDKIKDLWEEYHLQEDLLRFITLKTDEVKQELEYKQLKQQQI